MELTQDKIDLIEKLIKTNRKFINNEDLYEDFFNETCKRSMPIISAISSDSTLEVYLKKVATTSILNVLKDSGRLRRSHDSYKPSNEIPLETVNEQSEAVSYSDYQIKYEPVDFDNGPEDLAIKKELISIVLDSINSINAEEPEKQYLELYNLRYRNGMTQNEIATELNLSQSEVSKRLFKLVQKIKATLNDV